MFFDQRTECSPNRRYGDAQVVEPQERKKITVPASSNVNTSPSHDQSQIVESSERKKIVIPSQSVNVTPQHDPSSQVIEGGERKKIVIPSHAGSTPQGTGDSTDGKKTYVASDTYRLVREMDETDPGEDSSGSGSFTGSGQHKPMGKAFAKLQQSLE